MPRSCVRSSLVGWFGALRLAVCSSHSLNLNFKFALELRYWAGPIPACSDSATIPEPPLIEMRAVLIEVEARVQLENSVLQMQWRFAS